jgi:homoserine dehydrogenase
MARDYFRVALTGFGSVGQGIAEILVNYPDLPIQLVAVADRSGAAVDAAGLHPAELLKAKQGGTVANHPQGSAAMSLSSDLLAECQANILIEAASTNYVDAEPGWTFARTALEQGLDVVLVSKGPLVLHWDELFALAAGKGRTVKFSGTHGSPLPSVDFVRFGLTGSQLRGFRALLNSTTGFVLEAMERGLSYQQALEWSKQQGVIETDPALDLEGVDASAKCVILSRALFNAQIGIDDVSRTGITRITGAEVREAAAAGTPLRLVARVTTKGRGIVEARVQPERLDMDDPLAGLRGGALGVVYDAIPIGQMFIAGYGKGGIATAAAAVRDVLNIDQPQRAAIRASP